MSLLKYVTAGGSDPRGKQKIWYCCHPRDFALYFKKMSVDLCSVQKCSVWYEAELDSAWDDELEDSLAQMQLFVVPVTERFLTQPSRARQRELAFAMERNIPVLPVILEDRLDKLYANVFGELQYLDRVRQDETAIPYDEKLKNYLSGVLVGDKLAEKVRSEFTATIFMSYRKKDRRHAQELMRLIHDEERCRDVSIWYDEFLIPGESFNVAILAALKNCDLFALAVTPNLTEPGNYVMTTEYVCARDEGKPILPAEMVATSREELAKGYAELPAVVDARDTPALSAALRGLPRREKGNDRQHKYRIGLAFLNGIGVEKDAARALKLITEASDAGMAAATDKLATMYQDGIGVQRDSKKALELCELAVKRMERVYAQGRGSANLMWYLLSLFKLALQLLSMNQRRVAFATVKRMEALCRREEKVADTRLARQMSLRLMGKIKLEDGKLSEAEQYLLEAERLLRQEDGTQEDEAQDDEAQDDEAQKDSWRSRAASLYDMLGSLYTKREEYHRAAEMYGKALEQRRVIAQDGSASARSNLAATLSSLSCAWRMAGAMIKAGNCYAEALQLRRRLVAESEDDPSALMDMASLCGEAARFYASIRLLLPRARRLFREQRDICARLTKGEKMIAATMRLATAEYALADTDVQLGRYGTAERGYRRGIALCSALESDTDIIPEARLVARFAMATGYSFLGDLYRKRKNNARAMEKYLESAALMEEDPQAGRMLARLYDTMGRELLRVGSPDAAYYCRRHTDLLERLVKEDETTELQYALRNAYNLLAHALAGSEQAEKAARSAQLLDDKLTREELRLWQPSSAGDGGALNIVADWTSGATIKNTTPYTVSMVTKMFSHGDRSGKIMQKLNFKEFIICESLVSQAHRYTKLGLICEKLHGIKLAERLHRKALALSEKAVACRAYEICYHSLATCCYNAGMLGSNGEGRDLLKRSYRIITELCRLFPKNKEYIEHREMVKKGFIAANWQADGNDKTKAKRGR